MLKAAPQVAILATSREPLRAEGEWLLRLPSLEVPPEGSGLTAAEALSFSAVELFSERATAALGGFGLADADIPAVLEICRHLDGVPLAIELAAAQVDVFGVKGLAARLDDRFAVLTRGRRTALPRQQTLRATIDWSYELLPEAERRLLRRLAVFPAGFDSGGGRGCHERERRRPGGCRRGHRQPRRQVACEPGRIDPRSMAASRDDPGICARETRRKRRAQ